MENSAHLAFGCKVYSKDIIILLANIPISSKDHTCRC